ncbi:MAG: hypothetical protein E6J66_05095 [Deltaproteobacteria bacterium]|nr:MAG: hypothetical protein E6J66_05095 [Deltaproteobacteria bacterium]
MAEQAARRGGAFQRLVLWLLILALLAAVGWLASERNQHRFRVAAQGSLLVIERGRFFPTGTAPLPPTDKAYGPVPVPAGEKPPADTEFDDQNALDRWLFDLLGSWARNAGKKGDGRTAAALVDRASALPGLTGAQIAELNALRADLAWDDAQTDIATAAQLVEGARRKLEAVRQGNGAHAADASALSGKLEGVQNTLRDLSKH